MIYTHLLVDIELTNRCNALCFFCPREKTPQQGVISRSDFFKAVERVQELPEPPKVSLTGQGEPTLHPEIVEFVQHLTNQGLRAGMTSNASRMGATMSEDLLSAGLKEINFSISDFGDDYENVYNLDFQTSMDNVLHFIEINDNRCEITINIVVHDINRDKIPAMKDFWRAKGITSFLQFQQVNRGGACEHGKFFSHNQDKREEAELLMRQRGISSVCGAPFAYLFVGWNGRYYICCNDYEKTTPLGHVSELDFSSLNEHKMGLLACGGIAACLECDLDPTNKVRELLFEKAQGLATEKDLEKTLNQLKRQQQHFPELYSDLDWRNKYIGVDTELIASTK